MRGPLLIVLSLLLLAVSCIEKEPSWDIHWQGGGSGEQTPGQDPQPQPAPDTTIEVTPTDVALLEAFAQDFKGEDTAPFSLNLRQDRDDFRFYSGFPSLSEANTDILLLRLDPADRPSDCPRLTAGSHTFYGSYSARVRTPDISRIKKTTDALFEISIQGDDPKVGVCGIGIVWELSKPDRITLSSVAGPKTSESITSQTVSVPDGCSTSSKFQTLGWDWSPDYVRWWILNPSDGEKIILGELTDRASVPSVPAVLSIRVFHTEDAPEYPFETEIDRITYEPDKESIQAWRDKYFR